MKINKLLACLAALASVLACSNKGGNSSEAEHHHEESLALSAYSENYELFAEVHPLCTSEASSVAAHITRLSDFKPVTDGSLTAVLSVGGNEVRQEVTSPKSEGIFSFSIEPKTVGEGTLDITYDGETFSLPVSVFDNEEAADEYAEEHEAKSGNGVSFTKEKSWKVDFATAVVENEPFGQVIKTISKVEPYQGDEMTVVATASGVVSFSSLVEGQSITKGKTVCKIISGGISDDNLQIRYAQAESEYNLAKSEYERKLPLAEDKIVSQTELQNAKARYDNAKVAFESIKKNFSGNAQNVTSSLDGFVRSVMVSNGQYVEAGDPIAVISKSTNVTLKAEVQPKYYESLRNITGANFHVLNSDSTWSLQDLSGKVLGYGHSVQDGSTLVPVTFSVSNRAGFLPGSYVETYIKTTSSNNCITVPNGAIVEEMGNYFVYVQLTPEFFEKTQVSLGATDGVKTEITSGLSEGQRVVSKGAILVKLAQASGTLDPHAGHVH